MCRGQACIEPVRPLQADFFTVRSSIILFHAAHTADFHSLESALEEAAAILAASLTPPDRPAAPQVFRVLGLGLLSPDKLRDRGELGAGGKSGFVDLLQARGQGDIGEGHAALEGIFADDQKPGGKTDPLKPLTAAEIRY